MFRLYAGLLKGASDNLKEIVLAVAAEDPDLSVVDFIQLLAVAYPDRVKIIFL